MVSKDDEEILLRSVALQNAHSIQLARQHAEQEVLKAKAELELRTKELAQSLAAMRATLESTTDGILVTDRDGRVTGFNEKFLKMWQIPREIVDSGEHRRLLEVTARQFNDPQSFRDRIESIYASSPPESYDLLELGDGRAIERFSSIQFLDDPTAGRVWSFRDITQRMRTEEVHSRLAAIIESSEDAIVSKTLDGVILTWNRGAERMFGYTADEVIGKPVTILIPPDHADEEPAILEKLKSGKVVEPYETVRMRKDGTLIDISLTVSPIVDSNGRIVGASKIARDITYRTRAERALQKASEERDQLLEAERAARSEAERQSRMKDEFLANVSHELRTPLNAILGWAQILLSGKAEPDELNQGLETIERSARVQSQLIEDLLDMSRIVSGKVRLDVQQIDLASVVEAAADSVRPSAEAKGIRFRKILDPLAGPVSADPNRLQQVVWNLLSNAVKFAPKGGSVEVLVQRVSSHLEITVNDSGRGISPEFLPHVFERFRQADSSTTRKYGGLGLGLSIVKQLVELHGGNVRAESAGEGRGATFVVSLPLAPVRGDQKREHPTTPTRPILDCDGVNLVGVKVLVIDDEADACALIKRMLLQCKANVITAASAAEGLELLKAERPDVIVSDIGMPEKDGYQFMREVRNLPQSIGGKTPAVALTAFARSEDRTRAMLSGYQMHISKPIEPQELIATVGSLAGRMGKREDENAG